MSRNSDLMFSTGAHLAAERDFVYGRTAADRQAALDESIREPRARAFAEGRGYSILMQEAREWIVGNLGDDEATVDAYGDETVIWGIDHYMPGGWEYFAAELG